MKKNIITPHALFYNSQGGDRRYGSGSFTDWASMFFTDGIFNGDLQVIANNDMTITINPGVAFIGGKMKGFESTIIKLDTANGSYDRIDSIFIRRDDTKRDLDIIKVTGSPSTAPTAPAKVRAGNTYDLKIAEIRVKKGVIKVTQADIYDTRPLPKECGWVTQAVNSTDFSQFTKQFESYVNNFKNNTLDDITNWFNTIKGNLKQDLATSLQMQIDEMKKESLTFQKKIESGYELPASAKEGDLFILLER